MKIKLSVLLILIVVIICSGLYINRTPSEVLLAIPDHYRGKLTIKQDARNGKQPDVKALENHADYIYEFHKIESGIVYVKTISHIINAKEILVSKISVAPLSSKIISKNKKENIVVIEVSNWK